MNNKLLPGAILLLAIGLILNALALFFGPMGTSPVVPPAMAQPGNQTYPPTITYLNSDTYFLTSNPEGTIVYLWYYDYSPMRRDNRLEFVTRATAP